MDFEGDQKSALGPSPHSFPCSLKKKLHQTRMVLALMCVCVLSLIFKKQNLNGFYSYPNNIILCYLIKMTCLHKRIDINKLANGQG